MRFYPIVIALALTSACPAWAAPAAVQPADHAPSDLACGRVPPVAQDDIGMATGDEQRRGTSKDPCAVADNNLARDEAAILSAETDGAKQKAAPQQVWDHKSKPQFLDLIRRRFDLQQNELAVIGRLGFAVPARLQMPGYAQAYHEIFQSQLPVYITADSIFHAVFASHDAVVDSLERQRLSPMLAQALNDMSCALATSGAVYSAQTKRDLDLYILVARRLLAGSDQPRSAFADGGVEREAGELVAKAIAASDVETVSLFGRSRVIDFTQYGPRGHYTADEASQQYFRAAMWASRLEFNLVSRSSRSSAPGPLPDPSETPREAIDAVALADLATRSGAAKAIADMDVAWAALAGRREDVSIAQLAGLRDEVGPLTGAAAFDNLKRAIGDRFRRTVRLHPMPEGSGELPAITTLLGPRIVADAGALLPLVAGAVAGRDRLGVEDVAYSFGLDRAKTYLDADLAAFPALAGQLEVARTQISHAPAGDDLYSAWLRAIRALARTPEASGGTVPSFLKSEAGEDLRLNTVAAAYGQLKHNYALVAGQPYAEFGCAIPDGYVEPVPAAYDALIDYMARGAKLASLLDPKDGGGVRAHFVRAGQVLHVLRTIVGDELAGRALTTTERRWLGMVAEFDLDLRVPTTGYPPMYTGWYFDLFLARQEDGMRGADYIADFFTSQKGIAYAGATAPRLGIFVVDAGGGPRAFVGPVARAYEVFGPLARRYTDETAKTLAQRDEPWARAYTIPAAAPPPSLQLSYEPHARMLKLTSDRALGAATLEVLDHHRVAIETLHVKVRRGETRVAIAERRIGGVYIKLGAFRDFAVAGAYGDIEAQWGTPPPER